LHLSTAQDKKEKTSLDLLKDKIGVDGEQKGRYFWQRMVKCEDFCWSLTQPKSSVPQRVFVSYITVNYIFTQGLGDHIMSFSLTLY